MRKLTTFLFIAIFISSCALLQKPPTTIGEVKAELICVDYQEGMTWEEVAKKFGEPNIAPLPEPGTDLSVNTRVYENAIVIFHTKRDKMVVNGKTRFREIVYKIELCKKR